MICKECGLEMRVTGSQYGFEGDDSPDTKTKLFAVLTLACRNPNCAACGKPLEVKNEIKTG